MSKNHALSLMRGSRFSAARRLIALKPHWASEKLAPEHRLDHQVVGAGDEFPLE